MKIVIAFYSYCNGIIGSVIYFFSYRSENMTKAITCSAVTFLKYHCRPLQFSNDGLHFANLPLAKFVVLDKHELQEFSGKIFDERSNQSLVAVTYSSQKSANLHQHFKRLQ